ncbi:Uncharacterised protein [Mycobacteroides abscessus subsp. abscessus]|uniref:helix-turn-helix domain-containing protein n=1 Tax=Mycobacteroides abscessus TaxID=36809 RepID=UPI0009A7A837|nr:helix-turn-helix domain-containing protein [Mycobacteroides abscessus]SLH96697.1 Uncharacterised protein [Mycobacteroides abscessus subsp. abscessus]
MTEMDVALSPLLTYVESGRYLRKSARFVRDLVYAGDLEIKRIGRTPYVHRADLDAYIASTAEVGDAARRPGMTPAHKRRDVA